MKQHHHLISKNLPSTDTHRKQTIYPSDKFSSTKQYEDEAHTSKKGKEPRSAAIKRKCKEHQSSSSSITTIKQSTRFAAKRVRFE